MTVRKVQDAIGVSWNDKYEKRIRVKRRPDYLKFIPKVHPPHLCLPKFSELIRSRSPSGITPP